MIETETEAVEELLRKIQKLEQDHANLTQEIITNQKKNKNSNNSSESEYENMLQSMGQSVYMFDVNNRIVYWNRMSEHLYGYTVEEALGKTAPDIIIEARYSGLATLIIQRAVNGETWSGQFPVRTKCGDTFSVITTLAPCRDQNGTTFGVTCVCTDTRQFPRQAQAQAQAHHHFQKLLPPCSQSDIHIQNLDVEISWDDLIIQEQIGTASHGSTGTLVYHALLYGSDVAVKIFTHQEYPHDVDVDVILSFRKEVCLMKRLRHPNTLLFMGAVISPQCLCIVTEFLSRGSLFSLLQRNTTKLDWRRRLLMAMDIARGMNYLHNCQPPIVHRNLKSSNLLIDKNWAVKVGDFGLSRIKHATYLATNTGTGTPHWMAPEILRNEQVDEKSDVYSYGVVLWEITTGKIPWENLNAMQVIGTVGFMNERLEIPDDVDPQWGSLIESCWSSEARSRPTFEEILIKLKDLQRKLSKGPVAKKG